MCRKKKCEDVMSSRYKCFTVIMENAHFPGTCKLSFINILLKTFLAINMYCNLSATVNCSLESLQPAEHFYKLDRDYGEFLSYNTSINASCVPGYERESGDFARTCLLNTSLSGTELVCTGKIDISTLE